MLSADNYRIIQSTGTESDLFQLYQLDPDFYPALLESVGNTQQQQSFDILFFSPQDSLYLDSQQQLYLAKANQAKPSKSKENNFLNKFNYLWEKNSQNKNLLANNNYYPFSGGWFVYFSYELANQIEPGLKLKHFNQALPIAYACRYANALIYDHQKMQLVLFCEDKSQLHGYTKKIESDLKLLNSSNLESAQFYNLDEITQDNPEQFLNSVKKIKQYIVDGDVFQVNLSRKWQNTIHYADNDKLAVSLYQRLREKNPAPFSALVRIMGSSIISSSPERLVKVKNNTIESRPIAGTRPRGKTQQLDKQLIKQLHEHPKEKSEHVMLIDLIRNDLGRVCIPGSIYVNEFMVNETYQHVHHIVSNVCGKLDKEIKPGDVIGAIFPGGTITGCPKVRCMEIIAELEQTDRSAYTGSLGYINNDGSMDLNILIRTMQLENLINKQRLSFRAGAGIVADSIADKELMETGAKAKGLINALM